MYIYLKKVSVKNKTVWSCSEDRVLQETIELKVMGNTQNYVGKRIPHNADTVSRVAIKYGCDQCINRNIKSEHHKISNYLGSVYRSLVKIVIE